MIYQAKYIMKNAQLKILLKDHIGAKRDETVDFIWNQLASKNIKLDIGNKDTVLQQGMMLYDELLKDW